VDGTRRWPPSDQTTRQKAALCPCPSACPIDHTRYDPEQGRTADPSNHARTQLQAVQCVLLLIACIPTDPSPSHLSLFAWPSWDNSFLDLSSPQGIWNGHQLRLVRGSCNWLHSTATLKIVTSPSSKIYY
jgi:hypothetical protein